MHRNALWRQRPDDGVFLGHFIPLVTNVFCPKMEKNGPKSKFLQIFFFKSSKNKKSISKCWWYLNNQNIRKTTFWFWLTDWFTHSMTLTQWPTHSMTLSLTHSLIHSDQWLSVTHSQIHTRLPHTILFKAFTFMKRVWMTETPKCRSSELSPSTNCFL